MASPLLNEGASRRPPSRGERWSGLYARAATALGQAVGLLVLVNLLLAGGLTVRERYRAGRPPGPEAERRLRILYPDLSLPQILALRRESDDPAGVYEPFLEFRERPRRGRYVNVDPAGFRWSRRQGPWPPAPEAWNVFLFGGSTAFGTGVPDDQTLASHLADSLTGPPGRPVRVYNFGQAWYFSVKERLLFENLLAAGHAPDLALFLDGLGEAAFDEAEFAGAMRRIAKTDWGWKQYLEALLLSLPMSRLAAVGRREARANGTGEDAAAFAGEAARRYAVNQGLITEAARRFRMRVAFVWQPVPTSLAEATRDPEGNGDVDRRHLDGRTSARCRTLYREVGTRRSEMSLVWCADIQTGMTAPPYVDDVHYSGPMNQRLASCIAEGLTKQQPPGAEASTAH